MRHLIISIIIAGIGGIQIFVPKVRYMAVWSLASGRGAIATIQGIGIIIMVVTIAMAATVASTATAAQPTLHSDRLLY